MTINTFGLVCALACVIISAFDRNINATIGWTVATLLFVVMIIRDSEE